MKNQTELIMKKDWDILIIMDALRYDYAKKVYPNAEAVESPAIWTMGWLKKTWIKKHNDIIYVSGNTYCNSKMNLTTTLNGKEYFSFFGKEFFYRVVDAWDYAWDDELKLINPKGVLECAKISMSLNKDKKFIIHFMQPHVPFASHRTPLLKNLFDVVQNPSENIVTKMSAASIKELELKYKYGDVWYWEYLRKKNPRRSAYGRDIFEYLYYTKGAEEIKKAYKDNIAFAAPYIKTFTDALSNKKIILTADHGNYLGENGHYGHHPPRSPILTTVPWVTVKK